MPDTALLIIDIQNDYFPGGAMELEGADAAGAKAGAALEKFRNNGNAVIHVRHLSVRPGSTFFLPGTRGADIHAAVAPQGAETIVEKNFPNSFRATNLEQTLKGLGVKTLVVAGMMTHMCVDATVRHAHSELWRRTGSRPAGARRVPRRAQRFLRKGARHS